MNEFQSLSPTKWECKYHVVFIPKYRRKVLYGQLRSYLGEVFRSRSRSASWRDRACRQRAVKSRRSPISRVSVVRTRAQPAGAVRNRKRFRVAAPLAGCVPQVR